MGDSVWNDFLDETIEERYGLVAERVEEISKDALVPGSLQGIFFRGSCLSEKDNGTVPDGKRRNLAAAQSGDLQGGSGAVISPHASWFL